MTLESAIRGLIARKSEGVYWDFKLEHHDNNAALIHDVLCLANAEHRGERYIVFGVQDATYALRSITNTANRKNQAEIVNVFRDNSQKFFESRFPSIHLREIEIDGSTLDVLVIEDRPFKPYHLVEDYRKRDKLVGAHHIYTRINDTNTPLPDSAAPHEIIRMWRERFALDRSPLERVKGYLRDENSWAQVSEEEFGEVYRYHRIHPEFTLKVAYPEYNSVVFNDEWTRGESRKDGNSESFRLLYYHQTPLHRARYIAFDGGNKSMVAPDYRPRGRGRFYFYDVNSVDFALQRFYSQVSGDDSKQLRIGGQGPDSEEARGRWGHQMSIPVLRGHELDQFLGDQESLDACSNESEQYQLFLRNQLDFEEWRSKQTTR